MKMNLEDNVEMAALFVKAQFDRVIHLAAHVTNGAIVIHTQRLKSDPGGNLLS
ncbi:hypothetical protein AT418_001741 [Escherichia coli]|nr:hypothetical protein [Escherichia coli]EFA4369979.1 chemotaxis protein [Escherichia coli]EFB6075246.1 hypothetical protein [Escherichia coli]EFC0728131.1 hypothetical protein [Escherichia coli]EFC2157849.1 chemotaxis protein [Escherichia coli]